MQRSARNGSGVILEVLGARPGCGGLLLGLVGAVGALAVIVLFIPFWAGLVVVAGIVIRQLANVAIRGVRIATLKADIARLNQGKP